MSPAPAGTGRIDRFLACAELDDLSELAVTHDDQTAEERVQVSTALRDGDEQAVANLLMHPEMIAVDERFEVLERALGDDTSYAALAAVVGLQDVDPATLVERQAEQIGQRLLALSATSRGVVAERASVTLQSFAGLDHLDGLVALLDSGHEVVRHNALVAILALLGPSRTAQLIRHHVHETDVSEDTAELVRSALIELDRVGDDVDASELGAPLLGYIPNLADW